MKKIDTIYIKLSIAIISALALCALYVYLYTSLLEMNDVQNDFAGDIKNAPKIIREEKNNKEIIKKFFLSEGGQAGYISSLEDVCGELSLVCFTKSLNENPEPSGKPIKILKISMSTQGSFVDVLTFLNRLESSQYSIDISKSDLSAQEEGWVGDFEILVPVLLKQ